MIFSLHSIVVVGRRKILMPAAVNKRSFLLSRAVYTSSLCWLKYRILFDKTLLSRVLDISLCSLSFALCDRLQVYQYAVIARLYPIYFSAVAVVFNFNFFKFFPYHSLVI